MNAVTDITARLTGAAIEHIAYFSGGKGVRVLIRQEHQLWKRVQFGSSCASYGKEIVSSWLRGLQVQESSLTFIDAGPYTINGGTKSDLQQHPTTKLWPQRFNWDATCETFDSNYNDGRDDTLCAKITQFWKELPTTIPKNIDEAGIEHQQNCIEDAGESLLNDIKRIVQAHVDKVEEFNGHGVVTDIRQKDGESIYVVRVKGVTWCERGNRHHSKYFAHGVFERGLSVLK